MDQRYEIPKAAHVYYVAPDGKAGSPGTTVVWSPAATDSRATRFGSLDEFRKLASAFEAGGGQLAGTPRSIFRGPDLGRYELLQALPGGEKLPADIRKILGRSEEEARSAGAFPFRRRPISAARLCRLRRIWRSEPRLPLVAVHHLGL